MQSIDVVIGDVHARACALRALLAAVGAIDAGGKRVPGYWIVQVGDLLDRRSSPEANLDTARLAAAALDVVLVGNHEWRLLDEPPADFGPALATLAAEGWPHAASACGDWLITHAGVHPKLAGDLPPSAAECAEEIDHRWLRGAGLPTEDPLFNWLGPARGGDDPCGGIIWMHSEEWPASGDTPWPQIAGHVPQSRPRILPGPRWAIDIGGRRPERLAALVRPHGERNWRPVVVKAPRDGSYEPVAARAHALAA
jgi:hypothetical protein